MDLMQLIRIVIILLLIASLDAIVYFLALKFNTYYRRRIPLSEILKKEIGKGPIKPLPSHKAAARYKPNILRKLLLKFDTTSPLQRFTVAPKAEDAEKETPPVRKFKVGDMVEFFDSRGAIKGQVVSYSDNSTTHQCRYLVNCGKDGIWWASEDQIEAAETKKVEVAA